MKLQNMVKFPLTGLDMTPHVVKRSQSSWSLPSHWSPWRRPYGLGRDPEDYIYDLYAVCNHHGTMQGGHYTGLQCERLGVCADHSFRCVLLVTGSLCFRTSLSLPVGGMPTMRAVFILWISVQEQRNGILPLILSGTIRWLSDLIGQWCVQRESVVWVAADLCFSLLHFLVNVSIHFLEVLASPLFEVIVNHFYSIFKATWKSVSFSFKVEFTFSFVKAAVLID